LTISQTTQKIRGVPIPIKYDVNNATEAQTTELKGESGIENTQVRSSDSKKSMTDSSMLQEKRESIVASLAQREHTNFIKKTRAMYWNLTHNIRVICSVSKRYTKKGTPPYWYAYHPRWDAFLGEGNKAFLILGCMDIDLAFAIPLSILRKNLDKLNTTGQEKSEKMYWHIKIIEIATGEYALMLPKVSETLPLKEFMLKIIPR
jgi:hypothetical protein